MCGIAGFSKSKTDTTDARKLSAELLEQIVQRGMHATGMAWTDANGKVWYAKVDQPAWNFIDHGWLDELERDTRTVLLHTRYATKGSPKVEANNHPIVRPGIVGVHNGTIPNDDEIFELLGAERFAEVDSEAAFALIDESGLHPTEALTLLDGRVALAWLKVDDPTTMHVARWQGSPLAIGQTTRGSFVFASTLPMLKAAGRHAGLSWMLLEDVPEGWYFRVRGGRILDTLQIGIPLELDSALALMGGE